MMTGFPRIFRLIRAWPLVTLWLFVLVLSGALWTVSDRLESRRLKHALNDSVRDQKFWELSDSVGRLRGKSQAQVEEKLLNGRTLKGTTALLDRAVSEPGSELFFDSGTYLPSLIPGGLPAISFRATFSGLALGPRYAGWNVRLHFINNRLRGAIAQGPTYVPYEGPSKAWRTNRRWLECVAITGTAAGLVCLITIVMAFRWRRTIALIGLPLVLLAGVALAAYPMRYSHRLLGAPDAVYLWAALAGLLAISAIFPHRKRREADEHCPGCDYNLTGNVSGICPECGQATPRSRLARWNDTATAIEQVTGDEPMPFFSPQWMELKAIEPAERWPVFAGGQAARPTATLQFSLMPSREAEPAPAPEPAVAMPIHPLDSRRILRISTQRRRLARRRSWSIVGMGFCTAVAMELSGKAYLRARSADVGVRVAIYLVVAAAAVMGAAALARKAWRITRALRAPIDDPS